LDLSKGFDSKDERTDQPVLPESKQPESLEEKEETIVLETIDEHPYDLTYTCLLLPRHDKHLLEGKIENEIQTNLKQICITCGWRLEFLSIKPEYLQWTMRVPPTASTTQFMQVIREQTSQHIFTIFPQFKLENSPSDFWAPGYLIVWGSQQHLEVIIQRYIKQTRQQQEGNQPHA